MNLITSRDNPLVKELRRLSQDSTAYRKLGRVWLEGDHLCRAALTRGIRPEHAVFAQSQWDTAPREWTVAAPRNTVLPDALFAEVSGLESPARMGFVMTVPVAPAILRHTPTVVLDRVQDAGNVGSILRSASAFGFQQVLAIKGAAALWLLAQQALPMPCAWLMGHEGQGVSPQLAQQAALSVRIAQPGGEESLNVAAAAAICLHASATCCVT